MQEPLFSTTIPSQPRRQIPSIKNYRLYRDNDGLSTKKTFRHSDSTSRALASIAQSKYNIQERRRAAALLIILFTFALSLHLISGDYYFKSSGKESSSATSNLPLRLKGKTIETPGSQVSVSQNEDTVQEEEIKAITANIEMDYLNSVNNIRDFNSEIEEGDISFYWHVPRCAGSTLKGIIGECFGLVSACEVGVRDGHADDPELAIVEQGGARYVNVDTSNLEGIKRAHDMNLVSSTIALPQVIVSSYLLPIAQDIYDEEHKGRKSRQYVSF